MTHELKTWDKYFEEICNGNKTFEVRFNDRNYKKGDVLILKEWMPQTKTYSGRELVRNVKYVLHGDQFGIEDGYVVMSIE